MNKITRMLPVFLLVMLLAMPGKNAFAAASVIDIRQVNPDGAVQRLTCDKSVSMCALPFIISAGTTKQQPVTLRIENKTDGSVWLAFMLSTRGLMTGRTDIEKIYTNAAGIYQGPSSGVLQLKNLINPATQKITLYSNIAFEMSPLVRLEITVSETGMEAEHALAKSWQAPPPPGSELDIRKTIALEFRNLFLQKKFDVLNRMAEGYRVRGERTPSGLWKLTLFYAGVDGLKVDESGNASLLATAQEWVDKHPSPAAYIVQAKLYSLLAWGSRGSRYSDTVSQEQWASFHAYTQKAREVLEAGKAKASVDPEWYLSMIDVARDQQWPAVESQALYTEAITKFPYYYQIYFNITQRLLPKWGGSYKLVEEFAQSAVAHTKEKEGNSMYARIYWYVTQVDGSADNPFEKTQVDWNRMKGGIRDVLARYPDQWNINGFAYLACVARDKDETRSLMSRMKTAFPPAWRDSKSQYERCLTGKE